MFNVITIPVSFISPDKSAATVLGAPIKDPDIYSKVRNVVKQPSRLTFINASI